ncbi:heat shock 70 kd protein cognate 1 [Diplocarpon rosae]|nr:heat shock 70 kd protein cognate 1 [Diplocarpon rosae]
MSAEVESKNGTIPAERHAIGISFGNSNSSIAYTTGEDKAEELIVSSDRQIPSILSYVAGEEYNGQQAKAQLIRNSKNTVAYFRDYLGQDFKSIDPTHSHASAHPEAHGDTVAFKIHDKEGDEESTVTISEITTRHLRRLARSASDYTGKNINSAVITVPTNFSEKQKAALTKAATDAGLEVLQLIHEPVAALLAYDARPESKVSDKIVVVADLGGTRSDVAVIASRGGMYTILATAHDYDTAGVHLDKVLQDHFAKEFIKWNTTDPRENARSLAKLKQESEATKRALSIGTNANFSVESLAEGADFASTINRLRYETIARKVFDGFNRLIEGVHLSKAIGVLAITDDVSKGVFTPIVSAETAVPARRTIHINAPKEGGDVLVKIVEGESSIKVSKAEPKAKTAGENSEDSDDESDEEPEDIREKVWKVGTVLAEAAIKGVQKGGKVEVMINVAGDASVTVTCREVGGKGGVRGQLSPP